MVNHGLAKLQDMPICFVNNEEKASVRGCPSLLLSWARKKEEYRV